MAILIRLADGKLLILRAASAPAVFPEAAAFPDTSTGASEYFFFFG